MAGRQAKVITPGMLRRMLGYVRDRGTHDATASSCCSASRQAYAPARLQVWNGQWCSTVRAALVGP